MKTIPNAPGLYERRSRKNHIRAGLEALLAGLQPMQTITLDELGERLGVARSTVHKYMKYLAEIRLVHNTSKRSQIGQYKLTELGRRRLEDQAAHDEEAAAEEAPAVTEPPNITPPRLWHAASQPIAPPGSLNPWTGTTLREGALDFMSKPSLGIRA